MKPLCLSILIALAILTIPHCTADRKTKVYAHPNKLDRQSETLSLSAERIENEETYEIYFTLEKESECIKIDIISSAVFNEFTGKRESLRTFFIVEQLMDLARFGDQKMKNFFSEIGRNFDLNWERKRDIALCTDKNDPLEILKSGRVYRIRFSNFQKQRSDFEVRVQADCRVLYHDRIPGSGDDRKK